MITAHGHEPRPLIEPEPEKHRVDKPWQNLRARAARLGLATYRCHSDDDARAIFVVAAGHVTMLPDANALEHQIDAAEREDDARRGVRLRLGLEWEPRG